MYLGPHSNQARLKMKTVPPGKLNHYLFEFTLCFGISWGLYAKKTPRNLNCMSLLYGRLYKELAGPRELRNEGYFL